MAKEITKQVEARENKMYANGIDREFFRLYCEDNGELEKAMKDLIHLRDTTEAVSYTHLDVYKRQGLQEGGGSSLWVGLGDRQK